MLPSRASTCRARAGARARRAAAAGGPPSCTAAPAAPTGCGSCSALDTEGACIGFANTGTGTLDRYSIVAKT